MVMILGAFSQFTRFLLMGAVALFIPLSAHADRVVYFDFYGNNQTFNDDEVSEDLFTSQCVITLSNSGPTGSSQTYTVSFTGEAITASLTHASDGIAYDATRAATFTGAGTKNGSISGSSLTGTLAPNTNAVFIWSFPPLVALTTSQQEIRCRGSITVADQDTSAPGFVTANGVVTTWMQSSRAVNGSLVLKAATSLTSTPQTIGEGRPF